MGAFDIEVWDKSLTRIGWVGSASSVTCTPRHNLQPTGSITVDSDHELVGALSAPGARVVMRYQDVQEMSGPVRLINGELGQFGSLTYQVEDDWRLLRRLLAWQAPESPIGSQSAREYRDYAGPAETVVKAVVADALARLGSRGGIPVTIAPDQGRGRNVAVQFRMHNIADRLFPVVDQAGIGVTVKQAGAGLVVDCYEPQEWPITLSESAGTLTEGSWSRTPPTATGVVVQGPGDGVERIHRYYSDPLLEAEWGDVIEVAVDARDIKADDPNFEDLMAARGNEALLEGALKAGLSLRLSETETFRYGGTDGLRVGDRATAEVAPGVTITDVVREATISETADDGLNATPVLGERSDGDLVLARVVAQVSRAVRELRAGR